MRFSATSVYDFNKPSECVRRVALRARGEEEQDTDTAFVELLRDLGRLHEKTHRDTLPGLVDLSAPDQAERERATLQAIRDGAPAIYQPRFRLDLKLDGEMVELVGEPDFLIRDAARGGYKIRDSKLARNVLAPRHRGIPAQLQIYGLLYERLVGKRPTGLEVHAGDDDIVAVAYEGEEAVLETLREHLAMRAADPSAYEPTGWTKCAGCGFEDRCRGEAEALQDVALLSRVTQSRARDLHARGIRAVVDIAKAIEDPDHHDYFWTGKRTPRHKDFVAPLVRSAESWVSKTPIRLDEAPELPAGPDFAMLDLEGLPPYADDLDRTYLWGLKVFGDKPCAYLPAQAGFGPDGDREGWFMFLALADRLFAEYGPNLPFVHWSSHEKSRITEYIKRYGDVSPSRVAAEGGHKGRPYDGSADVPDGHDAAPPVAGEGGHKGRLYDGSADVPDGHDVASRAAGEGGHKGRPYDGSADVPDGHDAASRVAGEGGHKGRPYDGSADVEPPAVGAGLVPALPGVASRVLSNLVDLFSLTRNSVVLPLPSYSLKVVEKFVGFQRRDTSANGAWSIAKYIGATESNDPAAREAIVREILAYNEEDLDATWAVLDWLRGYLRGAA